MIAATMLAIVLAGQPLRLVDSAIDHGNRVGLVESAPFACGRNDDVAVCVADGDEDSEL